MYSSVLSVLFLGMVPITVPSVQSPVLTASSIPVAAPAPHLAIPHELSASGVLVVDAESGQEVFGYGEREVRSMASITKLMTALIIVENHELTEWVQVPESATHIDGSKAPLAAGEHFTVGDLLSAMLIPSANDAADTLAIYHGGSKEAFVEEMNVRAKTLGLQETLYANPSGLDHPDQHSTPRDIAWLAMSALRHPAIAERMSTRRDSIRSLEGTIIGFDHTHLLLSDPRVVAGKTGTTDNAGQCLVSLVSEGQRRYLVVLLNSSQRYGDMRTILRSLTPPVLSARLDL